jgi:hypothetical protein
MHGRRAGAVSWVLSLLAAIAVATGAVLTYAEHTVFDFYRQGDAAQVVDELNRVR